MSLSHHAVSTELTVLCVCVLGLSELDRETKKKSYGCVELCVYETNKIDYINKTQLNLKTYSTNTISALP